ncbi:MAG TPA: acetylglutamate kinase [Dehalococcoidia bacterium]|nr:acetylglutamate kinase [Dehalococcoidia bacterium]
MQSNEFDDILVVKIGGSTLGSHDTTLDDLAELQRGGMACVVVHGGGALVSDWLKRLDVPTRFENGLRVTDAEALKVVVAVLAGLVNKEVTASLAARGAMAVGISGADAGVLRARISNPALGLVGEITEVDAGPLRKLMAEGVMPVIAPVALEWSEDGPTGRLLNTNADTAAGAIAATLGAQRLVFLTDVPGVKADGEVLPALPPERAAELVQSGVIGGGMIPKVEACLAAAAAGSESVIVDGREEHSLLYAVQGAAQGTVVG